MVWRVAGGDVCTSALGVGSVWMNIVRRAIVADGADTARLHNCVRGLCCRLEAVMGEVCWCRHLVAMRGAVDLREGVARVRLRTAERGSMLDAIFISSCVQVRRYRGVVVLSQRRCV
jgi:hypothetical protein